MTALLVAILIIIWLGPDVGSCAASYSSACSIVASLGGVVLHHGRPQLGFAHVAHLSVRHPLMARSRRRDFSLADEALRHESGGQGG